MLLRYRNEDLGVKNGSFLALGTMFVGYDGVNRLFLTDIGCELTANEGSDWYRKVLTAL